MINILKFYSILFATLIASNLIDCYQIGFNGDLVNSNLFPDNLLNGSIDNYLDEHFDNSTDSNKNLINLNISITNQSFTNQSFTNQSFTNQSFTNQSFTNQSFTNQSFTNQSFINQSYCGTVDLGDNNFTLVEYDEANKLIKDEFHKCWTKFIYNHNILDELNHERFFRLNCLSDFANTLKCKCSNFDFLIEDGIRLSNEINSNIPGITKFFSTLTALFENYYNKELICYGLIKCERIRIK